MRVYDVFCEDTAVKPAAQLLFLQNLTWHSFLIAWLKRWTQNTEEVKEIQDRKKASPGSESKTEHKGSWRVENLGRRFQVTGLPGTEDSFKQNRMLYICSIDSKFWKLGFFCETQNIKKERKWIKKFKVTWKGNSTSFSCYTSRISQQRATTSTHTACSAHAFHVIVLDVYEIKEEVSWVLLGELQNKNISNELVSFSRHGLLEEKAEVCPCEKRNQEEVITSTSCGPLSFLCTRHGCVLIFT